MRLSEYVTELQKLIAEHGDLDVVRAPFSAPIGAITRTVRIPKVEDIRRPKEREQYEKYVVFRDEPVTGERVFVLS